jgi:hypothetical protein
VRFSGLRPENTHETFHDASGHRFCISSKAGSPVGARQLKIVLGCHILFKIH